MNLDGLTTCDLLELLEQARHDLRTCKKSLAFKESLLMDLELENAELSEINERLGNELNIMKRQEWRSSELDGVSDDGVDDGYGHWSHDEEDYPAHTSPKTSAAANEPETCSSCKENALERNELFEQIEELHQQLEAVQKVNKLLQEDVTQKTAQIAELTESLLQKQAREERLEADLEFTAAQREIALRDLQDSQTFMLASRRSSVEYFRSSSIGSSIGDELGLQKRESSDEDTPDIRSFIEWERFLAEPEAGPFSDFELACRVSSPESAIEEDLPSLADEQVIAVGTAELELSISGESSAEVKDKDEQSVDRYPAAENSSSEWSDMQYTALHSICPTLSRPFRQRAQQCKPINFLLGSRDHRKRATEDGADLAMNDCPNPVVGTFQDAQLD